MATLYVRDVPDEAAATLKRRAAAEGQSLSAYVASQLTALAARPTNEDIIRSLREQDRSGFPDRATILAELHAARR